MLMATTVATGGLSRVSGDDIILILEGPAALDPERGSVF
jgi:hypothetical protein